jgi:hypothetical protein
MRAGQLDAKMAQLRVEAPDLAELVVDGRIQLNEALAILEQRKRNEAVAENDLDEKLVVGYGPLAQFLTERGFPISKSMLSKLGAPSIAQGPQPEGYWNKRPAFRPSCALAWARARMRRANPAPTLAKTPRAAMEATR